MTLTRIALVVSVVTSSSALAEEPLLAPTWSVGAGVSFNLSSAGLLGGLGSAGPTPGGLGGLGGLASLAYGVSPVAPNVSIERMFSSRFAMGLGLEASGATISTVGASAAPPSWGGAGIGVSPRFTLTPETAPVAFTVLATVFTGYSSFGYPGTSSSQTFSLGASGGIALEKRFLERFAVRVQAQVARVTLSRNWSSYMTSDSTTGVVTDNRIVGSVVSASFVPSPSIELRLYL